jgi:hypothetical protein
MRWILVLSLAACGGPGFPGTPRPSPVVAAAVAAAAATITTAADPDFASRTEAEAQTAPGLYVIEGSPVVPPAVFDRIDPIPAGH